jgi:hypothetical protein
VLVALGRPLLAAIQLHCQVPSMTNRTVGRIIGSFVTLAAVLVITLYALNPLRTASFSPWEATLVASPAELRRIAAFLVSAANTMEEVGDRYDHQHLSDHDRSFRTSPQFVICRQR